MGSTSVEQDVDFDAFALITCHRLHDIDPNGFPYEITGAELVDTPQSVDLGYVDHSFGEEEDDFDPMDLHPDA